jgi:hypothetical protein
MPEMVFSNSSPDVRPSFHSFAGHEAEGGCKLLLRKMAQGYPMNSEKSTEAEAMVEA